MSDVGEQSCQRASIEPVLQRFGRATMVPTRLWCALIGLVLAALLVVAAMLVPDVRGHGTHEQLGLGPCTFASITGWRCPGCGMTTSWSHLTHGDFRAAIQANVGGTGLCLLAMIAVPIAFAAACGQVKRQFIPSAKTGLVLICILGSSILIEWLVRLAIQGRIGG